MSKFNVGDIVTATNYRLRSGAEAYDKAIVIQSEPLIIVSEESDMRWSATVNDYVLEVIGKATDEQLAICMRRLHS